MTSKRRKPVKRHSAATPGYHETREADQLAVYRRDIDEFIEKYKAAASSPNRQTLFFFPGGMACQLKRSTRPFKAGVANPALEYELMWLRPTSFTYRARRLGMVREGANLFRDKGNHIVIADGAVNFLGRTPHDGLIQWCEKNNIDLFVYNWDWRRRQEDTARFFVDKFWPEFKRRVIDAGIGQAAQNFSLLGHSFGGMIVNLVLRDNDSQVAQKLAYAITAATPFYGYAGQVHRWFEGETLLNGDGKDEWVEIVQVINSMPGLYVLHYLDAETYQRDGAALAKDPEFPLVAYPSLDADTRSPLDPWQQQTDGKGRMRYPENSLQFQVKELAYARKVFRRMAEPLNDERFYNIRGVNLGDDGKPLNNTIGAVTCGWITSDFSPPTHRCPIANRGKVPGDDTQPAWTTRLVTNDPARWRTARGKKLGHACLMSHPATLRELGRILLGPHATPAAVELPAVPDAASQEDMVKLRGFLSELRERKDVQEPTDEQILAELPEELKSKLPSIARRIIEDILKRPDAMH